MNGHAAAAKTINVRREGAMPARSEFDLSALSRGQMPSDWVFVTGWVSVHHGEDPFLAIRHDIAGTTPNVQAREDESAVPLRFADSTHERYRGPRGKLVVMRKK